MLNCKVLEISVTEALLDYQLLMQTAIKPLIIDVREPWEWDIVSLPQSFHVPLGRLLREGLDQDIQTPLFTLCHHGVRSLKAALWLRSQGFQAQSIKGGIEQWAYEIDPGLKRY